MVVAAAVVVVVAGAAVVVVRATVVVVAATVVAVVVGAALVVAATVVVVAGDAGASASDHRIRLASWRWPICATAASEAVRRSAGPLSRRSPQLLARTRTPSMPSRSSAARARDASPRSIDPLERPATAKNSGIMNRIGSHQHQQLLRLLAIVVLLRRPDARRQRSARIRGASCGTDGARQASQTGVRFETSSC